VGEEEHAESVEEAAVGFGMAVAAIVRKNYSGGTFSFSKYVGVVL
jgi:hypothetical protein